MPLPATPNLNLFKPEPSVTSGPLWAQMINDIVNILDEHDHTSGKGKRITAGGININGDLDFKENDATNLRSARYQLGTSFLVASDDRGCVYVKDGNLHYNNAAGAAVQITSGTAVVSSITGAFTATTPGGYPYTVGAGDAQRILLVNTTSARTINLPLATTALLFAIKDVSGQAWTNNISVVPSGANTIDGVGATRLLNDNFGWTFFISDGVTNWSIGAMRDTAAPSGTVSQYAGSTTPAGYLLCDGAVVSQATYPFLFTAIGALWNTGGEGAGNFRLPDMRGRFPLGRAVSGTGSTLGGIGGALDHTHTTPAHFHAMGTGATLNVTASGSHVHDMGHGHTGGNAGSHAHDMGHGHTGSSGNAGSHFHYMMNTGTSSTSLTEAGTGLARSFDATNDFSYDAKASTSGADVTRTSVVADHSHTVTINAMTGNTSTIGDHSHTVSNLVGNVATSTHTHASADIAGTIGLVTGGVNGNAAMTSGQQNPAFAAVNYIIKT